LEERSELKGRIRLFLVEIAIVLAILGFFMGTWFLFNVSKALCKTMDVETKKSTRVSIFFSDKKEIQPDILNLRLSIKVHTNKEIEAINILGNVDQKIRKLNLDYKGGNYRIEQNCWWTTKKGKICEGVNGHISYNFELKDYKEQNKLYEALNRVAETYPSLIFEVSEPVWIASQKLTNKVQNEIKIELIEKAQDFRRTLTEKLGKTCHITSISFSTERYIPIVFRTTMLKSTQASDIEVPEPKRDEKTIEVSANVEYLCE
jgi:hypothetical protein